MLCWLHLGLYKELSKSVDGYHNYSTLCLGKMPPSNYFLYKSAGMCTIPFRPRRYKLPRRLVKSSKQSPQVAAYRDNWSGIRTNHVAFIIWAFYGLVNAVVACRMWYWFLSCTSMLLVSHCRCWLRSGLTSFQQSVTCPVRVNLLRNCDLK